MAAAVDIDAIRGRFPALGEPDAPIFLENAGGAQVPDSVIEAMALYLRSRYVQLGAGYPRSEQAAALVEAAHRWMETFVGGSGHGSAILGPSSTQLLHMLAGCWGRRLGEGDEIVVAESNHEANVGCWLRLIERGVRVRWWRVGGDPAGAALEGLDAVLGERTRLVCFPHVSNLLGGVIDVPEVARRARAFGARTVVDGVAFAPHRLIDVAALGCDWYVLSTYKVFGPHMALLFGTGEAIAELEGPNHFFIPRDRVPYVFELGGACHEGCAGLLGLAEHLRFLAGEAPRGCFEPALRATVRAAMDRVEALERPLQERLIERLGSVPGLRILGPMTAGPERVPTVSVVHDSVPSARLAAAAHAEGIGIRHGHMYSLRLCEALGIPATDAVCRISAVHYNTVDEIDRACAAIERAVRRG
ncbi:MAG TPA: aminotransferase class V-fold PLP-dependent enzyme [Phycisphaerales bacterium]|nr:aminotransferase class V-fold PLP-dependent enzyme [Phycisphaerales bacterium]HMP37854.1 aminotransferase class V-fold PLP-dependent enzyme [Phycisphaerales bacterium]